jgi:hypothetical protein
MTFRVIDNPKFEPNSGFTNAQFKALDDLYCRAAAQKILLHRTVECDFEEGIARYTYFKSQHMAPVFEFVIRKVGPKTLMYETYAQGRGRIAKSGVFSLAFEKLRREIEALLDS